MTDIAEELFGYRTEVRRLEAEIERLRGCQEGDGESIKFLADEIERLRADNHKLMMWNEQLQADLDARRAHGLHNEIELLREERMRWRSDNEKLSADNDRLRALLQEAIRLTMSAEHNKISPPKWVIEARRALEREP